HGKGYGQQQPESDLPHRSFLPAFFLAAGTVPYIRAKRQAQGWKPRDVEPKLAQTQGCGRHGMATIIEGRESGFKTNPDYKITFEPSPRRVRVQLNVEIIANSTKTQHSVEETHLPVYYSVPPLLHVPLLSLTVYQRI